MSEQSCTKAENIYDRSACTKAVLCGTSRRLQSVAILYDFFSDNKNFSYDYHMNASA